MRHKASSLGGTEISNGKSSSPSSPLPTPDARGASQSLNIIRNGVPDHPAKKWVIYSSQARGSAPVSAYCPSEHHQIRSPVEAEQRQNRGTE